MWGNDKSGSDVAVGCLAEALLWSFSDFDCCFVMVEPLQL